MAKEGLLANFLATARKGGKRGEMGMAGSGACTGNSTPKHRYECFGAVGNIMSMLEVFASAGGRYMGRGC